MMRRGALVVACSLFAALAGSGPASASYAPALDIKLDPPRPATAAIITATVTQMPNETASRTLKVSFPAGFEANPSTAVTPCTDAQEEASSCPERSRIGTASAEAALGPAGGQVPLSGNAYLSVGSDARILVYLSGFGGLVIQKLVGTLERREAGGFDVVFDNLPATLTSSLRLRVEGGPKALLLTPRTCGPLTFTGDFTSRRGERAPSRSTVELVDCASQPASSSAISKPRDLATVRGSADLSEKGFGTTLTWTGSVI
jgi:hypothetical protein